MGNTSILTHVEEQREMLEKPADKESKSNGLTGLVLSASILIEREESLHDLGGLLHSR